MVGKERAVVLLCAVAAASAALALATLALNNNPAGAATDQLPDLGMAKISNVQIQTSDKKLLRFSTRIVNIGAGVFELHGSRSSTGDPTMTVTQRIFNDAGGYRDEEPTSAEMYYSGDGHAHWHAKNLARYTLTRPGDPAFERTGSKQGFCFYDNVKWFVTGAAGVPAQAVYTGCANNQPAALNVKTGLSRGWGDRYGSKLVGQYIDITGLPDGSYRLTTTADEDNWFVEVSDLNNSTWADLRIQGNQVSVTAYGPSAPKVR